MIKHYYWRLSPPATKSTAHKTTFDSKEDFKNIGRLDQILFRWQLSRY